MELQPVLERTAGEVEAMMARIDADKAAAAATRAVVEAQEAAANEKKDAATAIADDAQARPRLLFCSLLRYWRRRLHDHLCRMRFALTTAQLQPIAR